MFKVYLIIDISCIYLYFIHICCKCGEGKQKLKSNMESNEIFFFFYENRCYTSAMFRHRPDKWILINSKSILILFAALFTSQQRLRESHFDGFNFILTFWKHFNKLYTWNCWRKRKVLRTTNGIISFEIEVYKEIWTILRTREINLKMVYTSN